MRRPGGRSSDAWTPRSSRPRGRPGRRCRSTTRSPRRSMTNTTPEAAAFAGAVRFVREHAAGDAQARLLAAALAGRPERDPGVGEQGYRRFVRIPLAVAAAVCGDA